MRVTILQPTYWARMHVWNRILTSDVFVWLDHVQFARSPQKWEDRTLLSRPDGQTTQMRIPHRGHSRIPWNEALCGRSAWPHEHQHLIYQFYHDAPYYHHIMRPVTDLYWWAADTIERYCLGSLAVVWHQCLRPDTHFVRSSELNIRSRKGDLMLDIVKSLGGTEYLTGGPGADYLPKNKFRQAGIKIVVQDYQSPIPGNPSVLSPIAQYGNQEARRMCLG